MKAKIKFAKRSFFNRPPYTLSCPGILIGRGEKRNMWTMVFTATKQLSALEYEGDIRWDVAPVEQDFGRGVRFQLFVGTKGRVEGKEKIVEPDNRSDKELKNDKKAGKNPVKARQLAAEAAKNKLADKPEDKPKPDKPEPEEKPEEKPVDGPPARKGDDTRLVIIRLDANGRPMKIVRKPKEPGMPKPKDVYTKVPAQGLIAEGELFG